MMDYKKLDKLNQLRQSGALTDEEFECEKQKIMNEESAGDEVLGMKENNYSYFLSLEESKDCTERRGRIHLLSRSLNRNNLLT